ncbi:MAG: DUF5916 domain-containing protein [Petrimonas sp.]|nr:DUF5916 domain-containing protein [Petrimonas sp.]
MIRTWIPFVLTILFITQTFSQEVSTDSVSINIRNKDFVYVVKKMKGTITLDGVLDEPDWQSANKAENLRLVQPVDTGFAKQKSEVMLTYDDKALYMAVVFHDTIPGKRIAESFRRDFAFNNNDNLLTVFDTFRDQTNGFSFGNSASGAIWDGLVSDGSAMNLNWDSKVELKVKDYPDKWITEMRIPFKSLRYPSNSQIWYANFGRLDLKSNEKSAWAPVPRQFPHASLAYTGVLKFDEPLPKPRTNFSLIPYIYGGYHQNYELGEDAGYRKDFGMDAKIGLGTSMNLDLTYNPDFAQVEVDQQVMNIDRFELFYPEKRQFFLENSDLFANYGEVNTTPFFSRRIGLDAPVLGGARVSGKIGRDWRIGFMNMTTEKTDAYAVRNFTVLSVQKKILSRSNLGFMMVNKETFGAGAQRLYNRVAAFDANLASRDNIWTGKVFYHRSFQPGNPDKQYAQGISGVYSNGKLRIELRETSVGANYLAETGFVRRRDFISFHPEISYFFVPNKRVVIHGPYMKYDDYYTHDFDKLDHALDLGYKLEFRDRSSVAAGIKNYYIKLMQNFDPTHVSNIYLPAGSDYYYTNFYATFTSNNRKPLNGTVTYTKGGFFNGDYDMLDAKIVYRFQPYVNFTMNTTYTNMRLPQPFGHKNFWLIGPKLDVTFSPKVYLTTFVQYNDQLNNTNLNVRFQWRYKPVSDLFIVYTDNYFADTHEVRNRALVLKLTYWWN